MASPTREPANELADALRHQISSGELVAGTKLPTARELSESHGVALATAVRAVGILRSEGVITTVRGRGSYVAAKQELRRGDATRYKHPDPTGLSPNRKESAEDGYRDEIDIGERGVEYATPELAERLGVEVGDRLSIVKYRWMVGGTPTQVSTQWEPLELTEGTSAELPAPKDRGAPAGHARFAEIGWLNSRVTEDYRARMPYRDEARLLDLPPNLPVMAIARISYAKNSDGLERAIETADIIIRGDRVAIRSESEVDWSNAK